MSESERNVYQQEYAVNPDGVKKAMGIAAQKLVEAEQADKAAAAAEPGSMGNIVQAHHMDQAAHLKQEAELIATVLKEVVDIPNGGRNWMAMIEQDADHLSSPT